MFNKKSAIDKLTKRSASVLDIFNTTITDLSQINNEIDENIEEKEKELERLKIEHAHLNNVKSDNQKVISKIQSIFA